jgi:GTPase SAR1 family protein
MCAPYSIQDDDPQAIQEFSGASTVLDLLAIAGSGVTALDLSSCEVSENMLQIFDAVCRSHARIATLDLSRVVLGPRGAAHLAAAVCMAEHCQVTKLCLKHCALDDEQTAAIVAGLASAAGAGSIALTELDLSHNTIVTVPGAIGQLVSLDHLHLQNNRIMQLTPELCDLKRLQTLKVADNPGLGVVSKLGESGGVAAILGFLRDFFSDEHTVCSYSMKLIVAGPSMAGKSSLVAKLFEKKAALTTPDERTIGLDILRIVIPDPFGRAPNGVEFLTYDTGGHDEYQEMNQPFMSLAGILLAFDASRPRADDQDKAAVFERTLEQLVVLAMSIQACTPGAKVILVGSHADEGPREEIERRCAVMTKRLHERLQLQQAGLQNELMALSTVIGDTGTDADVPSSSSHLVSRRKQLQRIVDAPLRLSAQAIPVSAKTMLNFDKLRADILEAAFDEQTYPDFAAPHPSSYDEIYRFIKRVHATKPTISWLDLETSVSRQPDLSSRTMQVNFLSSSVQDVGTAAASDPASLDRTGSVTDAELEDSAVQTPFERYDADGNDEIDREELHHLFVELGCAVDDDYLTSVLDNFGDAFVILPAQFPALWANIDGENLLAEHLARKPRMSPMQKLSQVGIKVASLFPVAPERAYQFRVQIDDLTVQDFTVTFKQAEARHAALRSVGALSDVVFPAFVRDRTRDMTHNTVNVQRREAELQEYYTHVFERREVMEHPMFLECYEFNLASMRAVYCKPHTLVAADPDLLRRCISYLRVVGEVLYYEDLPALHDRVFLQPQWLVDVMKELVRHDLDELIEQIDPSVVDRASEMQALGRLFVTQGILDRRLLPWLWRDLRPDVTAEPKLIDELISLLSELSIATELPTSWVTGADEEFEGRRWLVPMRLPKDPPPPHALDSVKTDEVGHRFDFGQILPSGLLSIFLSASFKLCVSGAVEDTEPARPWRTGVCATLEGQGGIDGPVALTIRRYNAQSILVEAKCESTPGVTQHQQLLRHITVFEDLLLESTIAQRWPGCAPQVFALLPRSRGGFGPDEDGAEVSLTECLGCVMRHESTIQVTNAAGTTRRMPLNRFVVLDSASLIPASVQSKLVVIRFLSGLATSIMQLPGLKSVATFRQALEARVDAQLEGTYAEDKRWSAKLTKRALGDDAQEQERRCHGDGTGRALGLLLFLNDVYERSVDLIDDGSFSSMGELSEWLLGPFPWLEDAVRELAQTHQLRMIPLLSKSGLFDAVVKEVASPRQMQPIVPISPQLFALTPNTQMPKRPDAENQPGYWYAMISYTQRNAGAKLLAAEIYNSMEKRGLPVWLDIKVDKLNEAAMKEAAQNSQCIIAIVSGACYAPDDLERTGNAEDNAYFKRQYCINELHWAREAGVPIQPVIAREDKQRIGEFLSQAPEDLKDLGKVDFKTMDQTGPAYWKVSIDELVKSISELVGAPEPALLQAQSLAVLDALEPAVQAPRPLFELPDGKMFHFFICHHQGSGGDQANLLCKNLEALGYRVWYDNGQNALHRNIEGMREGVRLSVCLLIFLSGRKEKNTLADPTGDYEGPFTRWFCHEEMATAHAERLRCVGVMETEERRGKPDFALEKSRALTGGCDGGPVNVNAPRNIHLLDDVCMIPLRRQQHEVEGMLAEIQRHAVQAPALTPYPQAPVAEEGVPPDATSKDWEPEPEPEDA